MIFAWSASCCAYSISKRQIILILITIHAPLLSSPRPVTINDQKSGGFSNTLINNDDPESFLRELLVIIESPARGRGGDGRDAEPLFFADYLYVREIVACSNVLFLVLSINSQDCSV